VWEDGRGGARHRVPYSAGGYNWRGGGVQSDHRARPRGGLERGLLQPGQPFIQKPFAADLFARRERSCCSRAVGELVFARPGHAPSDRGHMSKREDQRLAALAKKNAAKVVQPKGDRSVKFDPTLRQQPEEESAETRRLFKEMKKREF
jgi:hypothetical protein